jgi:hypothetical protein
MGKDNKPQMITIDGKEFDLETFTDEQKMMVSHIADLDRKINSAAFGLDQLRVGKDAFIKMLKETLPKDSE